MNAQIVSFHCVLKDKLGRVLSSSFNRDVINQLEESGPSTRLRGLVAGIQNVRQGEKRQFTVPADEAYGPYDPELLIRVRRSDLLIGQSLVLGSEIATQGPQPRTYRVVEILGDLLVLDGNHPLAGHDLTFDLEFVSAREARSEDFADDSDEPIFAPSSTTLH